MIRFIDFLSYNASHVNFNSCILNNCKIDDIHLSAESKHIEYVKDKLNKQIKSTSFVKGRAWKLLRDFYFLCELFKVKGTIKSKEPQLVILGATGTQLFILAFFLRLFPSKRQAIRLFFHSELEFFDSKKGINKYFAKLAVKSMKLCNMINTAVLSSHIKKNMVAESNDYESVYLVRHPMPQFTEALFKKLSSNVMDKANLQLAVIGLLRGDTKNLDQAAVLRQLTNVNVNFFGRLGPDSSHIKLTESCQVLNEHYSDEWLRNCIKDVDFLLLSPAKNAYRFTALGTVSDSVLFSKPLIWEKHEAIQDYESYPLACVYHNVADFNESLDKFEFPNFNVVSKWLEEWNELSKVELQKFLINGSRV